MGDDLTPEGLEALLASLDPDPTRAAERYLELRRRLVRLFEWRGCAHPEELVDETVNRVARRLARGLRPDNLYAFFCGVAHLVHKEYLRREAKERRAQESADLHAQAGEAEDDVRLEHVRHCLGLLPPDQRDLLLHYHQEGNRIRARKELCDKLGIPMNALRIRVHRLRRKIETCVEERLRGLTGTR